MKSLSIASLCFFFSIKVSLACEMDCRYGISNNIIQEYSTLLQPIFDQFVTSDVDLSNLDFTAWSDGAQAKDQVKSAIQTAEKSYFTQVTTVNGTLAKAILSPVFQKYRGTCPTSTGCPNYNCSAICGSPGSVIGHLDDALSIAKTAMFTSFQNSLGGIETNGIQQVSTVFTSLKSSSDPLTQAFQYASMVSDMSQVKFQLDVGLQKLYKSIQSFCPTGCESPFRQQLVSVLATYP